MNENVFSVDISIRFRDLDAMGHVNNAVYLTYFEEGRKAFFYNVCGISSATGFDFIIARITCNYIRPIELGNPVVLQMWCSHIGGKSFNLSYRLTNPENPAIEYASGKSVQVAYDYANKKSKPIEETLRNILQTYYIPEPQQ